MPINLTTVFETKDKTASFQVGSYPNRDFLVQCVSNIKLLDHPPIRTRQGMGKQNRNIGFFSNVSNGYSYSGQVMHSQPLTSELDQLLQQINEEFKADYNGILINEYLPPNDYLSAHSDDERSLGNIGVLGIVLNYAQPRTFRIRAKMPTTIQFTDGLGRETETSFKGEKEIVRDFEFVDCSIYLMSGDFQKIFEHEVPIRKKCSGKRISFTFRKHLE